MVTSPTKFLILVLIACATALGGCGGDEGPDPLVTGAADKMTALPSSGVRMIFAYGDSPPAVGNGVVDQTGRRFRLDTKLPSLGAITQLFDDVIVYYRLPKEVFAVKRPWFKIDLRNPPNVGTLASMATISNNSPITMVDQLRGATRTTDLGDAVVNGTNTKHFKVTISLSKTIEMAPAEFRDSVKLFAERTRAALNDRDTMETEVWIDPESGEVKRQKSAFVFGGQDYRFDVTYVGGGDIEKLVPPLKSQVTDETDL